MKLTSFIPRNLVSLFLLISIAPLSILGAAFIYMTWADSHKLMLERQEEILNSVASQTTVKINSWKSLTLLAGIYMNPSELNHLLELSPDITAVQIFSHDGQRIAAVKRPNVLKLSDVDLTSKILQNSIQQQQVWQMPVSFFNGTPSRLPMVTAFKTTPSNLSPYLVFEFDLSPVQRMITRLSSNVALLESGRLLVAPQVIIGKKVVHEKLIPMFGWRIEIHEAWSVLYRSVLQAVGGVAAAIFICCGLVIGFGIYASKKITKELAQQERLSTLGLMTSVISHELRTAFAVIKNSTTFLKENYASSDPKIIRHLDILETQIETSNQIMSDILQLSKEKPIISSVQNASQLIEEVLLTLPLQQGIQIVNRVHESQWICIDPIEFKQAFTNVCMNGLQSMTAGGTLTVETIIENDEIKISVRDTGCGISLQDQNNMWDPFFTTKTQGTGLGLSIVKRILERYDGKILVHSKVGVGTEVIFIFKKERSSQPALASDFEIGMV